MKNLKAITVATAICFNSLSLLAQQATQLPPISGNTSTPHDYGKDPSTQKVNKHIISFGFFSPLNHHISFGYDQLIGTDKIFTSQLGIIGPGINTNNSNGYYSNYPNKQAGAFLELGGKFFFSPDFVTVGTYRYNSMQGTYFKPQIVISVFSYSAYYYNNYYNNPNSPASGYNTNNYTGLALLLNIGKQWIFQNTLTLDIYAGIGYNIGGSYNNNYDFVGNYYSYETGSGNSPIAFTGGVNLGIPF